MSETSVLVVDDEEIVRSALEEWLGLSGFTVAAAGNVREALALVDDMHPEVVLTDVRMPGGSGFELMRGIHERSPTSSVVLITGHGDVPMAVEAMREGAFDFIQKPYAADHLMGVLNRAGEQCRVRRELGALRRRLDGGEGELSTRLIGASKTMQEVRGLVLDLAGVDTDIIIMGETGTGKEVVARCLHDFSPRAKEPFVAVNCAAIPAELIESELFGHEAGAFTSSMGRRIGKFEYANGGTLLLDEIESMPLMAQAKVLRVIQERTVERLGSNTSIPLDVRILAATKVDLLAEAEAGRFRSDLYFRLNTAAITLTPLRARGEDVVMLFHHFLDLAQKRFNRPAPEPSAADYRTLLMHRWPGNVRELKSVAEKYVLGLSGGQGALDLLVGPRPEPGEEELSLPERLAHYERRLIEAELAKHNHSISEAARALKLPRRTLNEKIIRLGVAR